MAKSTIVELLEEIIESAARQPPEGSGETVYVCVDPDPYRTDYGMQIDVEQARSVLERMKLTAIDEALSHGHSAAVARQFWEERCRQITGEGFTPKHDEAHGWHLLARAGAAYAWSGSFDDLHGRWLLGNAGELLTITEERVEIIKVIKRLWPWEWSWWKPKDPRRDLVRAGALLIAAAERWDREHILHAEEEG